MQNSTNVAYMSDLLDPDRHRRLDRLQSVGVFDNLLVVLSTV